MVERVAVHLNQTVTEEQMVRVLEYLSFKNLASTEAAGKEKVKEMGIMNEDAGTFFRKGKFLNHFVIGYYQLNNSVHLYFAMLRKDW